MTADRGAVATVDGRASYGYVRRDPGAPEGVPGEPGAVRYDAPDGAVWWAWRTDGGEVDPDRARAMLARLAKWRAEGTGPYAPV